MRPFIDERKISSILEKAKAVPKKESEEIIKKALELKGLDMQDCAVLLQSEDPEIEQLIFDAARRIKDRIYGKRLVLFAPLYTTNECANNCLYCAFRKDNKELKRRTLTLEEIKEEVRAIESEGHKRILLVAGEDPGITNIEYLERVIAAIYDTRSGRGEIRRLNVNVAPMSVDAFKRLKKTGIGTYQLFQETYHPSTYFMVHPGGPKEDYEFRLLAMDRAIEAGIDDVGIGVLFGLYDYKFEILALLAHALHLEEKFGVGPHTISVPRIEPAVGAPLANLPPYPVFDGQFKKLVAVLRMAVPYTGLILSTRETAGMRNELLGLGISQISAGSRTNPGGYSEERKDEAAQFSLNDDRPTAQVIADILKLGYIPSFCTSCYRLGRTGQDFMNLAKPGEIHNFCLPNALLTLKEYLLDYAKDGYKDLGEKVILRQLEELSDQKIKNLLINKLREIEAGKRDLCF